MKSETEKITVTIEKKEASSIYNALIQSKMSGEDKPEEKGARDLKQLLQGNFFSSVTGVHAIR